MCGVCGTSFAYKEILRSHISTIHKKKCLKCGKLVYNLKSHTKKKHPSETNFEKNSPKIPNLVTENIQGKAKNVPKITKRGKAKIKKNVNHSEKSLECIVCEISFAYKKILNRHISTFHKGKACKCLKCGKLVFDLKLHSRNKHPKVQDEIKESTNENPTQILDNPEFPFLKKVKERSQETKLDENTTKVQMIEAVVKPKIETDIKPKLKPSDKNDEINTGLEVISSIKGPDDQKVAKKVYVPTGKSRGRPAGAKAYVPTGKPRGRPAYNPVTAEIQDDNDNTKKVLDNPKELPILKKAQENPKETKFDENIPKFQEEEKTNDNTEKVLDDPNAWALLKKAEELLKKYEDYEVKYYCNVCPDFSTIDSSTLIEHHCSFHEIVDEKKFTGKFSKSNNI